MVSPPLNPSRLAVTANPPLNPSFCEIMLGDFKIRLRIPPAFTKHMKRIRGKSSLRSTRGGRWAVDVWRADGVCFFTKGWAAFAADNAITSGDFLVFFFDGRSSFLVKVFGKSGRQKEAGPLVTGKRKRGAQNPGKDPTTPIKLHPPSAEIEKSRKQTGSSSSMAPATGGAIERELAVEDTPTLTTLFPPKKKLDMGADLPNPIKLYSPIARIRFPEKPSGSLSLKWQLVLQAALSLETSHPSFLCVIMICKTSVTIPTKFVRQYDLCEESIYLRNPVGNYWSVKLVFRTDGRLVMGIGWPAFRKGNCLREGDVCVFEILQQRNEMLVHIFRVKEENDELVEKSPREEATSETKELDQKPPAEEVTSVIVAESGVCNSESRIMTDKERVLNLAESIKTTNPKFVALVRKFQLYTVAIPVSVTGNLDLKLNSSMILRDSRGRPWKVNINQWKNGSLTLASGWNNFVKGNCLRNEDACVFEFLPGTGDMQVHIFCVGEIGENDSSADNRISDEAEGHL